MLADVDDPRATVALERALRDADPPVRAQAVDALASGPGRLDAEAFLPLLDDPDPAVAASAAVAASKGADAAASARVLIGLAANADPAVRSIALRNLANAPADAAEGLAVPALDDEDPGVRAAALTTLAGVAPEAALEPAIRAFGDPSPRVREAAVAAAAPLGDRSIDAVLGALDRPATRDAALRTLARMDLGGRDERIRAFVAERTREANADDALAAAIPSDGEAASLLKDALLERGRASGRSALRALSLISTDGGAVRSAVESLDAPDPGQVANALETLEATTDASLAVPILALWEPSGGPLDETCPTIGSNGRRRDDDAFVAACAGGRDRAAQREGRDGRDENDDAGDRTRAVPTGASPCSTSSRPPTWRDRGGRNRSVRSRTVSSSRPRASWATSS
jgi:HEAT repeat protein